MAPPFTSFGIVLIAFGECFAFAPSKGGIINIITYAVRKYRTVVTVDGPRFKQVWSRAKFCAVK